MSDIGVFIACETQDFASLLGWRYHLYIVVYFYKAYRRLSPEPCRHTIGIGNIDHRHRHNTRIG